MSIVPTTRLGRALVTAALVTGVAKIVPFLLQTFLLAGDELTELPPLTPSGTNRAFLLANPVTWFLAVATGVWVVLALHDLLVRWTRPAPPPRRRPARKPAPRKPASRSAASRTTTRTASAARPRTAASRTKAATPRRTSASPSRTTTRRASGARTSSTARTGRQRPRR
jgi:hypothetical protein